MRVHEVRRPVAVRQRLGGCGGAAAPILRDKFAASLRCFVPDERAGSHGCIRARATRGVAGAVACRSRRVVGARGARSGCPVEPLVGQPRASLRRRDTARWRRGKIMLRSARPWAPTEPPFAIACKPLTLRGVGASHERPKGWVGEDEVTGR